MMKGLEQVSQRLEEQVSLVERNLSKNVRILEDLALIARRQIRRIRGTLPLSKCSWEERLIEAINVLGEIERLIDKMEDVVATPPAEPVSLESLLELNAETIF